MPSDFEKVADFKNLYKAFKDSMAGKGFTDSRMKFQVSALDGVLQLREQILTKTYEVSPYNSFMVYDPKERLIQACSFKDKVVQHSLCDNVLLPSLSKEFLLDNYAGQIGKGTLFGLNRLEKHMRTAYKAHGMDCWILKADISKYFYSIRHDKLKEVVRQFVDDDDVYWLCKKFIDSTGNGVGLPLGNQISQVFALLYLHGMDRYIQEDLGINLWGRYMDDFFLIHHDKKYIKECLQGIKSHIEVLNLSLNNKTQIMPFKNGVKFCGFHTYVTKDGKVIRKLKNENKRAAQKKYRRMARLVKEGKLCEKKLYESYNAWKNHISHGNCVKLGRGMDDMVFGILGIR